RIIREEDPPKPSTRLSATAELPSIAAKRSLEPRKLSGLVRGELDWIVMKALEKDRNRRYETANGFAMDVQRYLADDTVLACPPSAWYRLRKWGRRHRAVIVWATAAATMMAAAAIVVTWRELDRIKAEKTQAFVEAGRLQRAYDAAEERRRQTTDNLRLTSKA